MWAAVDGFWEGYELEALRKYEGRPIVWETRKVRKEVSHNRFTSPHLPFVLPTNIKNASKHALATYMPHKYTMSPPQTPAYAINTPHHRLEHQCMRPHCHPVSDSHSCARHPLAA